MLVLIKILIKRVKRKLFTKEPTGSHKATSYEIYDINGKIVPSSDINDEQIENN